MLFRSFARIHKANLINNGIIPLEFENGADYDSIDLLDELKIEGIQNALENGKVIVKNLTKGTQFEANADLAEKEIEVIKAGGRLNYVKHNS